MAEFPFDLLLKRGILPRHPNFDIQKPMVDGTQFNHPCPAITRALTAAETGHLVFGTLHTTGAARTVDRIIEADLDPDLVARGIGLVVLVSSIVLLAVAFFRELFGSGKLYGFTIFQTTTEGGWYISNGDMVAQYDWAPGQLYIPIAFRLGKVIVKSKPSSAKTPPPKKDSFPEIVLLSIVRDASPNP